MPSEATIYPESAQAEKHATRAALARLPKHAWPDDCPDCGARMEFVLRSDAARTERLCPACGRMITVAQVLRGIHVAPPPPAPWHARRGSQPSTFNPQPSDA